MTTYDANGDEECSVDQLRIRYRVFDPADPNAAWVAGQYETKTMNGTTNGSINANGILVGSCIATHMTAKLATNLAPNTEYQWEMRVWYCQSGGTNYVRN